MVWRLVKWTALAALLYAAYKAAGIYSAFRFADHLNECTSTGQLCQWVKTQASEAQVGQAMRETMACVKSRQSWLESRYFPLDKTLSNPKPGSMDYREAAGLCKP